MPPSMLRSHLRGLATLLALVGVLAAPPGVSADSSPSAGADIEAVRAVGKSWMGYYGAGRYDAIPELYTEDTMVMPRGRPRIEGRAALRRSLGGLAAGRRVAIDITEKELVVVGDLAWFIGDFKVTYLSRDPAIAPQVEFGRSMLIYRRGGDGRWRIHRDVDSPAPEPATPPGVPSPIVPQG